MSSSSSRCRMNVRRVVSPNTQYSIFNIQSPAFTLLEVLSVMAIMVLLLTIALGSALGWGRSAGLRSSVLSVRSSLALARQMAVTRSSPVTFVFGNASGPTPAGYYVIATNAVEGTAGETNYLPKGFIFDSASQVGFLPDGTCTNADDPEIVVREIRDKHYVAVTVTVARLTGVARTAE